MQYKTTPLDNKVSAINLIGVIVRSISTGYHDNIIEVSRSKGQKTIKYIVSM